MQCINDTMWLHLKKDLKSKEVQWLLNGDLIHDSSLSKRCVNSIIFTENVKYNSTVVTQLNGTTEY